MILNVKLVQYLWPKIFTRVGKSRRLLSQDAVNCDVERNVANQEES